jgi:hypothetical protein
MRVVTWVSPALQNRTSHRRLLPSQVAIERMNLVTPTVALKELTILEGAGFREEQAAELLRMLAEERKSRSRHENRVESLVTGPDVRATARDTAVIVDQLFGEAHLDPRG